MRACALISFIKPGRFGSFRLIRWSDCEKFRAWLIQKKKKSGIHAYGQLSVGMKEEAGAVKVALIDEPAEHHELRISARGIIR